MRNIYIHLAFKMNDNGVWRNKKKKKRDEKKFCKETYEYEDRDKRKKKE